MHFSALVVIGDGKGNIEWELVKQAKFQMLLIKQQLLQKEHEESCT